MNRHSAKDEAPRDNAVGTANPTADAAPESGVKPEDKTFDAPYARKAKRPLVEGENHDQLAGKVAEAENRQETLLDEGLEESFPSSDPVSVKRIT